MDPSKASKTDIFEQFFFMNHMSVFFLESPGRGDPNRYTKHMYS